METSLRYDVPCRACQTAGPCTARSGSSVSATATYPAGRVYTVTEETDFEGNPTRTVYPSGKEILYTVNNANRITSIKLKNGRTTTNLLTSMTYVALGSLKSALYGDGYTQTRTYDKSYRLIRIKDALGTTRLRELTYTYEGRDDLNKVTDLITAANTETFTYTPRKSLTTAVGPYGALADTYYRVGNRLTAKLGSATDIYTYPGTSNQLSMINGVLQASYKYDAMGRQAIRTLTSPTPVTIHAVFDSDGRRIAEYNEGTGALIREYV